MKRNLLLLLAVMLLGLNVNAQVGVNEMTEAEYLINNGYSEATAEEVLIMKNRVTGSPCEPLYNKNQNVLVKYWKKFYSYIDPAMDNDERYHHDIKMSPEPSDL